MHVVPANHVHLTAWALLAEPAWRTRENAVARSTKVGAAVLARNEIGAQEVHGGCNIEDLWKASSIHAERTAIGSAVAAGYKKFSHILVAAEREQFTPCGNCLDFIMQFGGPEARVGFQPSRDGAIRVYTAGELMPHYPR